MSNALAAFAFVALLIAASPVYAAEPEEATQLSIDPGEQAEQGEPHEATLVLTDARGAPLAGRVIAVSEQIRMFDYTDTAPIDEVRTDHQGAATLTHTPAAPGPARLTAEFAGDEAYAAATATATIQVDEGVGAPIGPDPVRPDPLLPRGVTAVWFVPLLAGVWLAIGAAIYQLVRIPGGRGQRGDA